MRLDKLLSNLKYGTRSEITKVIQRGHVRVNGSVVRSGKFQVDPTIDNIRYYQEQVLYKKHVLLMMNKPKGVVSANKDALHETVIDLLEPPYNRLDMKIAGRLDIDTTGLLLLSDDGALIHSIISPKKEVYKTYLVEVDDVFDASKLTGTYQIEDGKKHLYQPSNPVVKQLSDTMFELSIHEGKFHQVKRMVEHFDRQVIQLHRISIGDIVLDQSLQPGEYMEIKKTGE